jgi:hypothetical protein
MQTTTTLPVYQPPEAVLTQWLEAYRATDPELRISDAEVATQVNLSRWQVQRFRGSDRHRWGGERRRKGE